MAHGNALSMGLEQGVLTLLGSKSSVALLRVLPSADLVLACCALIAALRSVPLESPVLGRVARLLLHALSTIALNSFMVGVSEGVDTPLACLNLLAVFFLGRVLDPDGVFSLTAQYLLVSNLSSAAQGFQHGEALPVAWALAFVPAGPIPADVAEVAQLVTVESFSAWLRGTLPQGLLLASTVALLYLFAPFLEEFPALARLYRFSVFALSNDPALVSVPPWLVAAGLWALWQADTDPIGRRLTATAGCNFAILTALDALRFAMDNDPAPVLISLLVAIQILEGAKRG
jgi:hypothetical protein